jgi:hypothetical protein
MKSSPDYVEVTTGDRIDQDKYNALVERRLLPLLVHADQIAANEGIRAFVTSPGIGCGAFAGRFKGKMETHLESALEALLKKNGEALRYVAVVYFGPHNKGAVRTEKIHGISFRVRPSAGKPLLCAPQDYAEDGEDLAGCRLYKFVAWDHVSWPGNDFFIDSRFTDDGVSAAASNSMEIVTGIKGSYVAGSYRPPNGYKRWAEVVQRHGLRLVPGNVVVVTKDGRCLTLAQKETGSLSRPGARGQ